MGLIGSLVALVFLTALFNGIGMGVMNAFPTLRSRFVVTSTDAEVVKRSERGMQIVVTIIAAIVAAAFLFAGKLVVTLLVGAVVVLVLFGVARKLSNRVADISSSAFNTLRQVQENKAE